MKAKKILLAAAVLAAPQYLSAQMVLNQRGQAQFGPYIDTDADKVPVSLRDTITSLSVFGNGSSGINGRISFGDHATLGAMNVFVGEVQGDDTDQLWLHGKKGVYYTSGPHANDTIYYYDVNKDAAFQFNCDVKSKGLFIASDSRFKENVNPLTNALETIDAMSAVTYNLKSPYTTTGARKAASRQSGGSTKEQQDKEFFDRFYSDQKNESATMRYGFLAQDVEDVCPELVHTDKSGYKYVDYIGLVPILVEAVKELKSELAAAQLAQKAPQVLNAPAPTSVNEIDAELVKPALYQNAPNPFNAETVIRYSLPQSVSNAMIYIFDMQGKQVRSIAADGRGEASVTVSASDLSAGMYIYTLIADGKEVSSRRMILTK